MKTRLLGLALVAGLACASAAQAETLNFRGTLNSQSEVPPNASPGTGQVTATLDTNTKVFTYNATFSGLTGPATAAHFHGPADPGANAPPVVNVADLEGPITGTATLTDAQITDLRAGKWYLNIHTAANRPGEIRGQVLAGR